MPDKPLSERDSLMEMGRHFARISRQPLKKQDSSDAWNERDNRLIAGRDAAKLLMRGAATLNFDTPGVSTLIDHSKRNVLENKTVGNSSVSSMTFGDDQFEYLVPTIYDGKRLEPDEAIKRAQQQMQEGVVYPKVPAGQHQRLDDLSKQISDHLGTLDPPTPQERYETVQGLVMQQIAAERDNRGKLPEINAQLLTARKTLADTVLALQEPPSANELLPEDLGNAMTPMFTPNDYMMQYNLPGGLMDMTLKDYEDTAKGAAVSPFTAAPDIVGLLQKMNMPITGFRDLGILPPMSGDPIREAVGLDPESGFGMAGEFLDPTTLAAKGATALTKLTLKLGPEAMLLAQPLLHASPFKFNFFDLAKKSKGEGFQAYSPGGIYFSSDDLVRGTHEGYIRQFASHPELATAVRTSSGNYNLPNPNGFASESIYKIELGRVAKSVTDDLLAARANAPPGFKGPVPTEGVVHDVMGDLSRFKGDTDRLIVSLNSQRRILEKSNARQIVGKYLMTPSDGGRIGEDAPQLIGENAGILGNEIAYIDQKIDVVNRIKVTKAEPYSYETHFPDDVVDHLPIFDLPLADQPAKYRPAVERLAKQEFDEWRSVTQTEIDDLEGAVEAWETYLADKSALAPKAPLLDSQKLADEIIMGRSSRPDKAVEAVIKEHKQRIIKKKAILAMDFDPSRTFGEIVNNLKQTHGDEVAQKMMMDAGIPGSRNRTYKTRQQLQTPVGAIKSMFEDEVYNYAIWDMNTVDRVVRRETKDGKILYDTAEEVYLKAPKGDK